jgi:deazaflavin-dependent oxidoreductase (nitroreductase family)
MTAQSDKTASAPRWVTVFGPIAKFLLSARVPLGFNGLITIRGRTSGEPRTTPIAIIDVSGRRWVWSPWGEVNWVRNLRAAGRATITVRGREEEVRATELDRPSESGSSETSSDLSRTGCRSATRSSASSTGSISIIRR